jgi:hypothetical protein
VERAGVAVSILAERKGEKARERERKKDGGAQEEGTSSLAA